MEKFNLLHLSALRHRDASPISYYRIHSTLTLSLSISLSPIIMAVAFSGGGAFKDSVVRFILKYAYMLRWFNDYADLGKVNSSPAQRLK